MMKKVVFLIVIAAVLNITGFAFAVVLQTPDQIEHFMRLDEILPFSHEEMFIGNSVDLKETPVLSLKLTDALDLGIKNYITSKVAAEKVDEVLGRKWQSMSALLPHLDASLLQERTYKENLSAQGFKGYGVIGPFNTFDARLQLVQKVIDLSALSKFKAVVRDLNAARYEREFARQKVVLLVSLNYLGALQAQGDFKAAEANLELSRELLKQTRDQFQAGLANSVDVARAETRLAQDEFRLASVRTSVHDAYLELQRSTGLPYDGVLKLMNSLKFIREAVPGLPDALSTARQERLDIRISQERLKASHYRLSEVKTKLLPQVAFLANYGSSGNDWNVNDHMTRGIMLQASMPIFDGGDISGQIRESNSQEKQLALYDEDLKRQVEEDVRKSLWFIDTSMDQVLAAGHVVGLSQHELELARDRFAQGINDNIEVINAQTSLAQARDQYVVALTQYHTARINLYFALGQTDSFYLQDIVQNKES